MTVQENSQVALPRPETTGADYFDIDAARAALAEGRALNFPPFELVHWGGFTFALNFRDDPIQGDLRKGRFYERTELRAVRKRLRKGAHVIDIGSNIGNHAVFLARRAKAARIVLIEPNPLALAPLMANIVLNGLQDRVVTDHLGLALSDRRQSGFGMRAHDRNLGATRLRAGEGRIATCPGDALFGDETPDFIKLDVEGMAMQVLAGLKATIARCRPLMLVEIDHVERDQFEDWRSDHRYRLIETFPVGPKNANYLITPDEGPD